MSQSEHTPVPQPPIPRTLIVGDVHGCAAELAALIAQSGPTHIILVGDLYTKGPDPAGVWSLIQQHRIQAVRGNHDASVLRHAVDDCWGALGPAAITHLRALPLVLPLPGGAWVVHAGLPPGVKPKKVNKQAAMYLRRWPNDKDLNHPFWWQCYQGSDLIIYGHDAMRGLVDRRGKPHPTLGLDTGCVYGGRLTGYLLETDQICSVPAQKTYHPIT